MAELAPALPLFIGALLAGMTRGRLRAVLMIAAPMAGALGLLFLPPGTEITAQFLGQHLTPVRVDELSFFFALLFHLAALIGVIFALHTRDPLQDVAALAYAGSAVGAVFAGDLLTLFIYWELLALTSAVLIFARRSGRALRAGIRYLLLQISSGLLLLAGAIVHARQGNALDFGYIGLQGVGGYMIFAAFGIKAAFPFLHTWLTDAYPESTPTGTVFLSAFTTKVAIYALARGFPGTEVLIWIGAVMTCFPIFFAVIENDLRRVLCYSLINQLGFMVVGIGVGTELALNGAVAHAFNDVLFKGLLLMSMGAVLQVTGEIRGSELGGLYKRMPRTAVLCLVGAASISAFPLFSGFVSKSIIMSATLMEGYQGVWLALLFASAGVFHHAGIKIPFFAFFGKDSRFVETAREPPGNMQAAMALAAALCILVGCVPGVLYSLLPWEIGYDPFEAGHVLAQLQLLAFSALAFTWLKLSGIYPPELRCVNLDSDWLFRRLIPNALECLRDLMRPLRTELKDQAALYAEKIGTLFTRGCGPDSPFVRPWPIGGMVLMVAAMLGLSLVLYYV